MLPKLLSWQVGLATVVIATVAVAGYVVTRHEANSTPTSPQPVYGRLVELSDTEPLGQRQAVLVLLGLNGDKDINGPSADQICTKMALPLKLCQGIHRTGTGRELDQDSKWYGYWVNYTKLTLDEITRSVETLIAQDPDLSRRGVKIIIIAHSDGGRIARLYWEHTKGQKTDVIITLSTPFAGAELSEKAAATQGIQAALPHSGKVLARTLDWLAGWLGIEFGSPGIECLSPNYQPILEDYRQHPLTSDWYLLAGTIDVSSEDAVRRNANLVLAGDQLFARMTGSGAPQDAAYYQITGLAMAKLGSGPNDGMVSRKSAFSEGCGQGMAHTIVIADHNHSEMLLTAGDNEPWATVMSIVSPRIVPQQSKVSGFDLWLPELPDDIKLPTLNGTTLTSARLIFADTSGIVWIAGEQGAQVTQLPLGSGEFSWPQWLGDDVVATRRQGGASDIVFVQASDGKIVKLTTDGQSSLAGVSDDGRLIAFLSNGNLMLRDKIGVAKVLVAGPLELDSPPVLMDDKVYFAVKQADAYTLYMAKMAGKNLTLADTKMVTAGVQRPIKIGTGLLAMKPVGDKFRWTAVSVFGLGLFNRKINDLLGTIEQPNIPAVTMMDIDERSFSGDVTSWDIYLVADQQVRRLDLSQEEGTWETVAPLIAPGVQLDVK